MVRRQMMLLVAAAVIGGCWLAQALSQARPGSRDRPAGEARRGDRQRGDRGARDRGDFRARMEEFRRRRSEQMREQFGATEAEWKVLQPMIEKVQQLQRESRGSMMRFARRGRRPGGRQPEGAPEVQQSDVEKKTAALRSLLEDKASGAAAIKGALDALRRARLKIEQELVTTQKALRDIVTMRQEARLVLMGVLP
jgi:hypothetical protein